MPNSEKTPVKHFDELMSVWDRLGFIDVLFAFEGKRLEVSYTWDNSQPPGLIYRASFTFDSLVNRSKRRSVEKVLKKELGNCFNIDFEDGRFLIEYVP